jgi:hypothetical protein
MTGPADFSQVANVISSLAQAGEVMERGKKAIPAARPAGAKIGEKTGVGRAADDPGSTGTGVASQLKEPDVGRRVYYPDQLAYDANGNPFIVNHIKKLYLADSAGKPFVIDSFGLPDLNNITVEA